MFPLAYSFDKSSHVYNETQEYIKAKNSDERLTKLFWAYFKIGEVIIQTKSNYWSGHFFPWMESWNELQISFNFVEMGFYKQAFYSLRSCLELGLLSVYWNLNDDGHIVIKEWLRSKLHTPKFNIIWLKLNTHKNFSSFQKLIDIKSRLLKLGYLHDYVHTKGIRYSNMIGIHKSNFQTFEAELFQQWFNSNEEVIKVLMILHLIKYPMGTVKFDFKSKFGIDIPSFGGLDISVVELFQEILGSEVFLALEEVAKNDDNVKRIMNWVISLKNMSEKEKKEQILNSDKLLIESMGFEKWLEMENQMYKNYPELKEHVDYINELRKWAEENGYVKSRK